jgi:hypothetical protein
MRQFKAPTVVRTLGLPRDFQVVIRKVWVRKANARAAFNVVHRPTGWSLRVRCVAHTLRAFVKWLLWRFRRDMPAYQGPPPDRPYFSLRSFARAGRCMSVAACVGLVAVLLVCPAWRQAVALREGYRYKFSFDSYGRPRSFRDYDQLEMALLFAYHMPLVVLGLE